MKRALFKVTPEMLKEALMLPMSAEIVGATWDVLDHTVVLDVRDEAFSDVAPKHQASIVGLRVTTEWLL